MSEISEAAKNFIYQFIDSVELLEVLLLLSSDRQRVWSTQQIAEHLRSNPSSVERRIYVLLEFNLIEAIQSTPLTYRYNPKDSQQNEIISEIERIYQVKRRRIFELIFSPLKGARDFADAFRLRNTKAKKDEKDD